MDELVPDEWAIDVNEDQWELLAAHLLPAASDHDLVGVTCDDGVRRWTLRTSNLTVTVADGRDADSYAGWVPVSLLNTWSGMAGCDTRAKLRFRYGSDGQYVSLYGAGGSATSWAIAESPYAAAGGPEPLGPTVASGRVDGEALHGVVELMERSVVKAYTPSEIAASVVRVELTDDPVVTLDVLDGTMRRTAQAVLVEEPHGVGLADVELGALRCAVDLLGDGSVAVEFVRTTRALRLAWDGVVVEVGNGTESEGVDAVDSSAELPDARSLLTDALGVAPSVADDGRSLRLPVPGVTVLARSEHFGSPRIVLSADAATGMTATAAVLVDINRLNARSGSAVALLDEESGKLRARAEVPVVDGAAPGLRAAVDDVRLLANELLVPLAALRGGIAVSVAEHDRCRWMIEQSFTVPVDRASGRVDLTGEFAVDPWPDISQVHIISTAAQFPHVAADKERLAGLAGELVAAGGDVGWITEHGDRFLTAMHLAPEVVCDLAASAGCDAVLTISEKRVEAVSLPDRRRWTRRRMALADVAIDIRGAVEEEEWDTTPDLRLPFDQL